MPLDALDKATVVMLSGYGATMLANPDTLNKAMLPKLEGNKGANVISRFAGSFIASNAAMLVATKDADAETKRKVAAVQAATFATGALLTATAVTDDVVGQPKGVKIFNVAQSAVMAGLMLKKALDK